MHFRLFPNSAIQHVFAMFRLKGVKRRQMEEEKQDFERAAEFANRAKAEFLARVSHEFRTPLNAIVGFSEILSQKHLIPLRQDKFREYARYIHTSSQCLLTLIDNILDFSDIESGSRSLTKEYFSVKKIAEDCSRTIIESSDSNGISVMTIVPGDLPLLYANKRAVQQILLNLLSNAIKFTPERGLVSLSAATANKKIIFTVTNTGKGIPSEDQARLIEPFIQGEYDPYLAKDGWGIGLAITKSLVDLHDGKLDIKSKVGKGTTVTVTFPNGAP